MCFQTCFYLLSKHSKLIYKIIFHTKHYLLLAILPVLIATVIVIHNCFESWYQLNSSTRPLVGISLLILTAATFLSGYLLASRRKSYERHLNVPFESHYNLLCEVVGGAAWGDTPEITDFSGMAIALAASRDLYWHMTNIHQHLTIYDQEFSRETQLGRIDVTSRFYEVARRITFQMRANRNKRYTNIVQQYPTLNEFQSRIEEIVDSFHTHVEVPLFEAYMKIDEKTHKQLQLSACNVVKSLDNDILRLIKEIESWENSTRDECISLHSCMK